MNSEKPVFDTSNLMEVFAEDIQDATVRNGVFHCTFVSYRNIPPIEEPIAVPVLLYAMPVTCVVAAALKAIEVVSREAVQHAAEYVMEKFSLLH